MQADSQHRAALEFLPIGHAAEPDLIVGVLVRARIERGQEDLALLVLQLEVGGDEQQVAGESRGVHRQEPHLLESDPEISAVGHDFQDARRTGRRRRGATGRLPVELSADGRDRLVGPGERLGGLRGRPSRRRLTASSRSRKCSGGSPKNPGCTPAGEQVAPRLLGVQQLAVDRRRGVEIGIFILDRLDLTPRPLEIAGEESAARRGTAASHGRWD